MTPTSHRAPSRFAGILRGRPALTLVSFLAGAVLFSGGAAFAVATLGTGQVTCPTGADLLVHPDGSWTCGVAPTTSPSPSPSVSPSPTISPSPSPTVSPSPSPTATGLLTGCFDRLAACGYPTVSSTGVPAGIVLAKSTGNVTVSTAGAVIQNREITGCIDVNAPNVTIRNVLLHITSNCWFGINTEEAGGPTTVVDTEASCTLGDAHGYALIGPNFHATRFRSVNCENALEINAGSSVVDSYLSSSEDGPGSPHGDDIQSQGGNGVLIQHNTFAGVNPITSSIITNPTANNGWTIENNFLSSGAFTLYCPEQGTNFVVRNNRFYPAKTGSPHSAAYGLTDACNHAGITWSGNYRDDNLSAVSSTA